MPVNRPRTVALAAALAIAAAACSPSMGARDVGATTAASETCDDQVRADVDRVVGAQLTAFAEDRWDAALALASTAFRDDFDAGRLASLIEGQFPVAADATGHELGPCVEMDERAQVLVSVVGRTGDRLALGYLLVREDSGWRIAGAVPVGADAEDEPGLLALPAQD